MFCLGFPAFARACPFAQNALSPTLANPYLYLKIQHKPHILQEAFHGPLSDLDASSSIHLSPSLARWHIPIDSNPGHTGSFS